MGISLVRFREGDQSVWGRLEGESVHPLRHAPAALPELLAGRSWEQTAEPRPLSSLSLLAPLTKPTRIICQGKNYLDHLLETGTTPQQKEFNLFFTKADSSLAPATGPVKRPPGVRLLDYELELGLVIGRPIRAGDRITEENLADCVAGFVMANDVSARDVQIPQRQWFKGKSFRTFCPLGPVLFLPSPEEFRRLYDLELHLMVNGETRQKSNTKLLLHKPAPTLQEIAGLCDLNPGDLLLTGTPGGVAMKVKPKSRWEELRDAFKSDTEKFAAFVEEQAQSPRYLKDGDRVECTIRTADGAIDLGRQSWVVE